MSDVGSATSIKNNESALMATQKFTEEESKIKEKAKDLKDKLIVAKKKKEEDLEKAIK